MITNFLADDAIFHDDRSDEEALNEIGLIERDGSLLQKLFEKSKETHYLRHQLNDLREERKTLLKKMEETRYRANTAEIQRMNLGELVENLRDENAELLVELENLEEENINYQCRVDLLERNSRSGRSRSQRINTFESFNTMPSFDDGLGEISFSDENFDPENVEHTPNGKKHHRRVLSGTLDGTASVTGESRFVQKPTHKRMQSKSSVRFDRRLMDVDVTRFDIHPSLQNIFSKRFVDVVIPDIHSRSQEETSDLDDIDFPADKTPNGKKENGNESDGELPYEAFSGSDLVGDMLFGRKRTQLFLQFLHKYSSELLNLYVLGLVAQLWCNFYDNLLAIVYFFPIILLSFPLMFLIWVSMNMNILSFLLSTFQVLFTIWSFAMFHIVYLVYTPNLHLLGIISTLLNVIAFLPFAGLADSLPTVLRTHFSLKLHTFYLFYVLSIGVSCWSKLGAHSFRFDSTKNIIGSTVFSSTLLTYAAFLSHIVFELWVNPDVFINIRGRYFHTQNWSSFKE